MSQEAPTLGESRVRVSFNPSANENVDRIKRMAADLIDLCEHLKTNETTFRPEKSRALAVAQTEFETAAMWAVKGATA